ncbi:hypothetical protein TWF730_003318 [Orbilia blumenaviensis]|uniref:Uncharacterized protein n=1 Tax=Orbilia blumenaviensis TaxID=1796055 RepID=A0AAV9U7N0_9PEZI
MQTGEPVARFSRPGRTSSEEATESPGQLDIYDCAPALLASATTLLVAQHDQVDTNYISSCRTALFTK